MIVLCCGMKRAGSTVQYQITSELVESAGRGQDLGFITERNFGTVRSEFLDSPEIVVLKTHDVHAEERELIENNDIRAIYIYRDLRDVAVSMMHKGDRPFHRFLLGQDIDEIVEVDKKWKTLRNMYISRYEVMIDDLSEEGRRIANFLNLQVNDSIINQIAEKYSLDKQRQRITRFNFQEDGVTTGEIKQTINKTTTYLDPKSLLHENHIHSGAINQWKTSLSPIQIRLLESYFYFWLIEHEYHVKAGWINLMLARIINGIKPLKPIIRKIYFWLGFR